MSQNKDLQKFVEVLSAEVTSEVRKEIEEVAAEGKKEAEEVAKKAVREVENIVVDEVLTWFQKLKALWPAWCNRPHQIENPSLAKSEETESTHTD